MKLAKKLQETRIKNKPGAKSQGGERGEKGIRKSKFKILKTKKLIKGGKKDVKKI